METVQIGQLAITIEASAQATFSAYRDWFSSKSDSDLGTNELRIHLACDQNNQFMVTWKAAEGEVRLQVPLWQSEPVSPSLLEIAKPLRSALGRKSRTILDATGGWGSDAARFYHAGFSVTVAERHPLMAMLLHNAVNVNVIGSTANQSGCDVVFGDSTQLVHTLADRVDCVYFDPMFPPKRKQSAKSNKYMQFLQSLLHGENDAAPSLESLAEVGFKRLVVKRPPYAQPLMERPNETIHTKMLSYDIYLRG